MFIGPGQRGPFSNNAWKSRGVRAQKTKRLSEPPTIRCTMIARRIKPPTIMSRPQKRNAAN
jgi:hypothetical protein